MIGQEAALFRSTFAHSLGFLAVIAVMTWLQATLLSRMVPAYAQAASTASTASSPLLGAMILAASAMAILMLIILLRKE